MQAKTKMEAVVRRDEYEYHVGMIDNKIYMYHKICYNHGHCHIWGSVLRLDTGLLEKYEADTAARENYKRLGIIIINSDEVQQIKSYIKQMLELYSKSEYDNVVGLYSATSEYLDNIINKYVTMLRDAYYNLYNAISLLVEKRKNKEREQYNLNIQAVPAMIDIPVYDSRYGVTIYTSSIYVWRAEYPVPGYDYVVRDEIQIELDKGIARAVKIREYGFEGEYEYGTPVWLYENEVVTLKDYIEQLIDCIEQYNYNGAADVLNEAAQYVRRLIV